MSIRLENSRRFIRMSFLHFAAAETSAAQRLRTLTGADCPTLSIIHRASPGSRYSKYLSSVTSGIVEGKWLRTAMMAPLQSDGRSNSYREKGEQHTNDIGAPENWMRHCGRFAGPA
jgi:hypothetical protein